MKSPLVPRLAACLTGLALSLLGSSWLSISAAQAQGQPAAARKPALPAHALRLPLVRQQTDYSCGPAALLSVLKYYGHFDGSETNLYEQTATSASDGTLPENLVHGARRFGLSAWIERSMSIARLQLHLSIANVVILELQAWRPEERERTPWRDLWDDGHYVLLIGLDEDFAYFMDPSTEAGYAYLPIEELIERWHDYNPIRRPPLSHFDHHLGVVINGRRRHSIVPFHTHRLFRLD